MKYGDVAQWRSRENSGRKAEGAPPLRDDSPVVLARTLEACEHVSTWRRDELLKRWRWVIDGYIDGFMPDPLYKIELEAFTKEAQSLITHEGLISALVAATEAAKRPLTETERKRKDEWQRSEALRRERLEQTRQRRLLREGHRTLTDIRRVLRGQAPSLPQASTPERSSPI